MKINESLFLGTKRLTGPAYNGLLLPNLWPVLYIPEKNSTSVYYIKQFGTTLQGIPWDFGLISSSKVLKLSETPAKHKVFTKDELEFTVAFEEATLDIYFLRHLAKGNNRCTFELSYKDMLLVLKSIPSLNNEFKYSSKTYSNFITGSDKDELIYIISLYSLDTIVANLRTRPLEGLGVSIEVLHRGGTEFYKMPNCVLIYSLLFTNSMDDVFYTDCIRTLPYQEISYAKITKELNYFDNSGSLVEKPKFKGKLCTISPIGMKKSGSYIAAGTLNYSKIDIKKPIAYSAPTTYNDPTCEPGPSPDWGSLLDQSNPFNQISEEKYRDEMDQYTALADIYQAEPEEEESEFDEEINDPASMAPKKKAKYPNIQYSKEVLHRALGDMIKDMDVGVLKAVAEAPNRLSVEKMIEDLSPAKPTKPTVSCECVLPHMAVTPSMAASSTVDMLSNAFHGKLESKNIAVAPIPARHKKKFKRNPSMVAVLKSVTSEDESVPLAAATTKTIVDIGGADRYTVTNTGGDFDFWVNTTTATNY